MKRKICVLTSSRADYNHLYILMNKLRDSKDIDFKLIITGMHTLKKFGFTYKEVIKDGFKPSFVIKTNQKNLNNFLSNNNNQNIRGYLSLEEMLEKEKSFDGISNTTPDKFHKETTLQILKSGFNVFCEKPLAENYSDAKEWYDSQNQ